MNPDDPYGENDPAIRAELERHARNKLAAQIKRILQARVRAGEIGGQSANDYAGRIMERPVRFLEDLSEAELSTVKATLSGGKKSD